MQLYTMVASYLRALVFFTLTLVCFSSLPGNGNCADNMIPSSSSPPNTPPAKRKKVAEDMPSSSAIHIQPIGVVENFAAGDLLYGLEDSRKKYISDIETKLKGDIFGSNHFLCTADRYNNKFLCQFEEKSFEEIQELLESNKIFSEEKPSVNKTIHTRPRPNLPNIDIDDAEKKEILKYTKDIVGQIKSGYLNTPRQEKELFKRFCKDAISYTIQKGHKIHFLLDGLNMAQVTEVEGGDPNRESYTSSELRYIYRNWGEFKGHIIFYLNGKTTNPPWTKENRQSWGSYTPKPRRHALDNSAEDSDFLE